MQHCADTSRLFDILHAVGRNAWEWWKTLYGFQMATNEDGSAQAVWALMGVANNSRRLGFSCRHAL
jgi:hypothetical protein